MKIDKDIFGGLILLSIGFIAFLSAIIFGILDYLKFRHSHGKSAHKQTNKNK